MIFSLIYLKKNIIKRKTVVSAAFYRFCGHALMGLGGLVPLVTIASFMIFYPCIIPLVALVPVIADFHKFCKITDALLQVVKENETTFKNNPTEESLKELRDSRELLYQAKRERIISTCLVVGTTLSAFGLIFPPLLLGGLAISLTCALTGFLDKRYRVSESVYRFICGDNTMEEEKLIKTNSSITLNQPVNKKTYAIKQSNVTMQNTSTPSSHPPLKTRNNQYPRLFTMQQPVLSVAPTMISMSRRRA